GPGVQSEDLSARRPQDQQLLRQDRVRRPSGLARHRRQHHAAGRADPHDPGRPHGPQHPHHRAARRRSAAAAERDQGRARHEARQPVLRGAAQQGRRRAQGALREVRSEARRRRRRHRSVDRRSEDGDRRRALHDQRAARRSDRDHRQHDDARRRDPPRAASASGDGGHRVGAASRLRPAEQPRLLREDRLPGEAGARSEAPGAHHPELASERAAHRYPSVGAGYSGGLTGTGLTGTLSYSQNNINGTGNSAAVRFERGSRVDDESLQVTIPYLGSTPKSQRYSLAATIFNQRQLNYYPVYSACGAGATSVVNGTTVTAPQPCPASGPQPVTIVPQDPTNYQVVNGIVSNYTSKASGAQVTLGRRLSDIFSLTGGLNIQRV